MALHIISWLLLFSNAREIGSLRLNVAKARKRARVAKVQSIRSREVSDARRGRSVSGFGENTTSSSWEIHRLDALYFGAQKLGDVLRRPHVAIDCSFPTVFIGAIMMLACFCTATYHMIRLSRNRHEKLQLQLAQERAEKPLALTIVRKSGGAIASVDAQYFWFGKELREAVAQYLAPDEHVHCFVWEAKGREHVIGTFDCIGVLGIEDGSEVQAVLCSNYALPSGVSFFNYRKDISGSGGACYTAKLWVHPDNKAYLECGEFVGGGVSRRQHLEGHIDSDEQLHFSLDGHDVQGLFQGGSRGQQNVILSNLPSFGNIKLEQDIGEAVFNVNQAGLFDGWITFFESGEVVANIAKRESEEFGNMRLHACKKKHCDGSWEYSFKTIGFFSKWTESPTGEALQSDCTSACGTCAGLVGKRKLALSNFPILGKVEIAEHSFFRRV